MKHLLALSAALALSAPAVAQDEPEGAPSPGEIVAEAPAAEWVTIAPENLLVMTLAPDAKGNSRQVVIQLMPAPFSQGWVDNIRTLARAKWYDGIAVVRVQDNYVVQWGDPNNDNPEANGPAKPLPEGLKVMGEDEYVLGDNPNPAYCNHHVCPPNAQVRLGNFRTFEPYAVGAFTKGWPVGLAGNQAWPVHCYGMVGVGRGYSPDTGTGAELYTVIGHAPRHLDRNIALVGRVVEGIEHLSSLPRGTGALGFYETAEERVPIESIRVASDLPEADQPGFEYLSTEGETFARYAKARANRRDPFFIQPAGGADICNIPVPVRRVSR
ncbi:peptidylprolyl isomerase [Altererythrobacter sp. CAU 1778]